MADDPRVLEVVEQYIRRQHLIDAAYGLLDKSGRVGAANHVAQQMDDSTKMRLDVVCTEICAIMSVPLAAVTLVNETKQLVLGACGMSHEPQDRDHSFCIFVAASGMPFQISDLDATPEELTCIPAWEERNIRAYLGRPLTIQEQTVGALCVVDFVPREWTQLDKMMLENYAAHVNGILEERT